MALPVINVPTYKANIPSTKEEITFRPFLVKEEKILLLALEDGGDASIAGAIKQIIHNCTFEQVDVTRLATFDLEYVFLRIRAKSVGEVAKVQVLCEDDGETYVEAEVPLDKVKVNFPEGHTNQIKLTDEIGVLMSYPDMNEMYKGIEEGQNTIDFSLDLIKVAIAQVYEGEVVHERTDFTDEELGDFLESLTSEQFASIQNFFETMPRLSHTVTVTNPNTKKKNKIKLEGLNSFFV
jgi:hypothetical protein